MAIASPARPRGPNAKTHRLIYSWITDEAYAVFEEAAADRREHIDLLLARTLQKIARPDVLDAILADDTLTS